MISDFPQLNRFNPCFDGAPNLLNILYVWLPKNASIAKNGIVFAIILRLTGDNSKHYIFSCNKYYFLQHKWLG